MLLIESASAAKPGPMTMTSASHHASMCLSLTMWSTIRLMSASPSTTAKFPATLEARNPRGTRGLSRVARAFRCVLPAKYSTLSATAHDDAHVSTTGSHGERRSIVVRRSNLDGRWARL